MTLPLRVLCLEDRQTDYELVLHELSLPGFEIFPVRVETEDAYLRQLKEFDPNIIIADHRLPSYDGMSALVAARRFHPDIPFIFVSGIMGEDAAIEALKRGATDYVLKQNLARLRPSVERAIREWEEAQQLAQAEQALHDSEALYHSLVESLPQNVNRTDSAGHFTSMNQQFCQFFRKPPMQVIGDTFFDLRPLAIAEKFVRNDCEIIEADSILESVEELPFPGAERRFIHLIKSPLRDIRKEYLGLQGIFWDTTKHQNAESRIRHLNRLLNSIRRINRLMVGERDSKMLLNEACRILVRMRGYALVWIGFTEALSKSIYPVAWAGRQGRDYLDSIKVTWDDGPTGQGPMGRAVRTLAPIVCNSIATDPAFEPWRAAALAHGYGSVAAFPLCRDAEAMGAIAVFFDRQEAFESDEIELLAELAGDLSFALQSIANEEQRREAEEKLIVQSRTLMESEKRYRELFENANDIIYTLDLNGNFTSLNKIGQQIIGFSEEQVRDLNLTEIVAPEHLAEVQENLRRTIAGELLPQMEIAIRGANGLPVTIEVSSRAFMKDGYPIGVQGIARDLTERNFLQRQFLQAQKMEAVGRLAGGIAHDFNNLLTIIMGNCDLLSDSIPQADPAQDDVAQIRNAGKRAADLTSKLLAFSRKQILQLKVINLNDLILENSKLLRRLIGEDIELVLHLDPSLCSIKADTTQMEQIIMNLAVNAKDAMSQGGKFTIETAVVELDENYVAEHPGARCGKFVMMSAIDTGTGMDADTMSHVFEPFFTTKEEGKGTGLSLTTVYGIVSQSGGHVAVESESGRGATFKIFLPQVEEAAKMESPHVPGTLNGTETILLVEDMEEVRALSRRALCQRGYTVIEASNGPEALWTADQHLGPIHILITDLVMPDGINGYDLAEQLRVNRHGIKVLLTTGYSGKIDLRIVDAGISILEKPFTGATLAQKVREVLNEK